MTTGSRLQVSSPLPPHLLEHLAAAAAIDTVVSATPSSSRPSDARRLAAINTTLRYSVDLSGVNSSFVRYVALFDDRIMTSSLRGFAP